MPRRTNKFQKLILAVQRLTSHGMSVTESAMVLDPTTGENTEVDILIEGIVAGEPISVAVECTALANPVDKNWVEHMHGKHSAIGTNKLVLVSKNGFTKAATKKAKAYRHSIYRLDDAESADWHGVMQDMRRGIEYSHLEAKPTGISLHLDGFPQPNIVNLKPADVFAASPSPGISEISTQSLLEDYLKRGITDGIENEIINLGLLDEVLQFSATFDKPQNLEWRDAGASRQVREVELHYDISVSKHCVDLRGYRLGERVIAEGSSPGGTVVVASQQGNRSSLSVETIGKLLGPIRIYIDNEDGHGRLPIQFASHSALHSNSTIIGSIKAKR